MIFSKSISVTGARKIKTKRQYSSSRSRHLNKLRNTARETLGQRHGENVHLWRVSERFREKEMFPLRLVGGRASEAEEMTDTKAHLNEQTGTVGGPVASAWLAG